MAMGQVAGSEESVFRQKYMSNELNGKGKRHSPASFDVSRDERSRDVEGVDRRLPMAVISLAGRRGLSLLEFRRRNEADGRPVRQLCPKSKSHRKIFCPSMASSESRRNVSIDLIVSNDCQWSVLKRSLFRRLHLQCRKPTTIFIYTCLCETY